MDWGDLTTEQRDAVVKRHEAGETWAAIGADLGITTPDTFSRKARQYAAAKRRREAVPSSSHILLRQIDELERKLAAANDYRQLILEAIEARCPRLPSIPPPPRRRPRSERRGGKATEPETAMLDLSDIHAGEVVRKRDTGNLSEYSWDLLVERVGQLRDKVLAFVDVMRASVQIDRLVVNALGDWVTGEDVFIGQGRSIDRILADQLFDLAALMVNDFFVPMLREFREVRLYAVSGNHGRTGKPGTHHPRTNFDYILYRILAMNLSRNERFKPFIAESPFLGYHLPDQPAWKHLLQHGDTFKSWMGIPYYGLDRYAARIIAMAQVNWNYIHVGHHHANAVVSFSGGEKLLNGSWVGGSDFSVNRLQMASTPKQNFYGMHPRQGMTWEYPIRFDELRPLVPDAEGLYTPVAEIQVEGDNGGGG